MANSLDGFDWTTPFIADACVQLSLPVRVGPFGLKPNIPGSKAAGPARPARHAGSTDVFLEAIANANSGDILVIDNGGRHDEGCIGDLVVGEAFMRVLRRHADHLVLVERKQLRAQCRGAQQKRTRCSKHKS